MIFRLFLIILVFIASLHALSDLGTLKRADGLIKSGSRSDHFRAYNDYKNIYLRSVMSGDKKLRIKSLNGIVKSGNILHIDISRYKNELLKATSKSFKKTKKLKKLYVSKSTRLKSAKIVDDTLVLTFDKKLTKNQVNYFKIYDAKKRRYRYVFDVHAILTKSKKLRKEGINRIRIAQYNLKTIRIVIEDSQRIKINFTKNNNKLIIGINSKKITNSKK